MPGALGRNLHLCFSKIKRPLAPQSPPNPQSPKDHNRPFPASAATSSSILIKNFNTLYDDTTTAAAAATPDFATIFASHRFFFSSPGLSNSIIESAPSMAADSTPSESDNTFLVTNSVAVSTYSPDPYMDFRKSMQEMVEASDQFTDVKANWDYLHELLLCYLALNPKSTHKFIVGAFADLLVSLMSPPPPRSGGREGEFAAGGIKISQQCM